MKKRFDCVDMKRKGAEAAPKRLQGMSSDQELAYWRERTKKLRIMRAKALRRQGADSNAVAPGP